ncbi:UNVERIFIED_ORG: hypothetical protein E4P37_13710 [Bacillus sp. AZ43]
MDQSVERVLSALQNGTSVSPDDLIAVSERLNHLMGATIRPEDAATVRGRARAADGSHLRLSVNASYLGGYSEALAATLFTPSRRDTYDTWYDAVSMKTAGYFLGDKAGRLRDAGWPPNSPAVDLLVSRESFLSGRWRPSDTGALTPGLRALMTESRPELTVQVKARVTRNLDSADDALPYEYLLDRHHDNRLTRAELVDMDFDGWKEPSLDLVVWVQWMVDDRGAHPYVRVAGRWDLRQAVRDRENAIAARAETAVWSSRKIDYLHVFGRSPRFPDRPGIGVGLDVTPAIRRLRRLPVPVT